MYVCMYNVMPKHAFPTRVPNEIFIKVQIGVHICMFLVCNVCVSMTCVRVPRKRE